MKTIGIYDSGCGGFSILNQIIKYGFSGTIYYYADSINNPWGPKSSLELRIILSNISQWFKKHKVTSVISGCNTTYSLFKDELETIFDIPVDNIFKETHSNYKYNAYSALCTENSFKSDLFSSLFPDKKIEEIACPNLANLIEKNKKNEAIQLASSFINKAHYSKIILGCTHYALLKNELSSIHTDHEFIDPAEYYSQTEKTTHEHHNIYFKVTGDNNKFRENINQYLKTDKFVIEKSTSEHFIRQ